MLTDILIGHFQKTFEDLGGNAYRLAKHFGISKSWAYELAKRMKQGKPLIKPRNKPKKEIFNDSQKAIIRQIFEANCYTDKSVHIPSITLLMRAVYEAHPEFPSASRETFRKIVKDLPLYCQHPRPTKRYRKSFEAESVGLLVQGDVSIHRWIPKGEPIPLLVFLDDHSRKVLYASFIESDNVENHIKALKKLIYTYGKPLNIYYDNDPKYRKRKPEKNNFHDGIITQALRELDIGLINSTPYVPQGKGKIERLFGTFQRQLGHYMKRYQVTTLEQAQKVLQLYVEQYNNTLHRSIKTTPEQRFQTSPHVFRPVQPWEKEQIENAFSYSTTRKVDQVNEISYNGVKWKVPRYKKQPLAGYTITVREFPGHWIKLFYKDTLLATYITSPLPSTENTQKGVDL